jgi:hypothetical protein
MAGTSSSGSEARFRERTPIFFRFVYKNLTHECEDIRGNPVTSQKPGTREEGHRG